MSINIKTLFVMTMIFAMACVSNCFAAIPDGIWYKTDGVITNELKINFNHPEKKDGKFFYGEFSDSAGSKCVYYKFGKPVISGNTATMTAYLYVDYYDDEDGLFSADETVQCIVTYSESDNEISFRVLGGEKNVFTSLDACNMAVCNENDVKVMSAPNGGRVIYIANNGEPFSLKSINSDSLNHQIWYQIEFQKDVFSKPQTGYVSSDCFDILPLHILEIPSDASDYAYSHYFSTKDLYSTIAFKRSGDNVMVLKGQVKVHDDAIPKFDLYLGIIYANQIIITKYIGPLNENLMRIYEQKNFRRANELGKNMDIPELWYYWKSSLNSDGNRYDIVYQD